MGKESDRFVVKLSIEVEKINPETGQSRPFSTTQQIYHAMARPALVELQGEFLNDFGGKLLAKGRRIAAGQPPNA